VGHVKPEHGTLTVQFAGSDPWWVPLSSGDETEIDPSDYRKQQIEDDIAWGAEL
jgi:hypothetical protein